MLIFYDSISVVYCFCGKDIKFIVGTQNSFKMSTSKNKLSDQNSEMKVESMNNLEEKEVLEKIYNYLSNAGYIRANFNGLTPFDRIAGGLMWCITGSDNLVNIGLLFGYGEELNIKKKILLSERIISALLHSTKRCPMMLQPHQIMGLDVDKIIMVVQWLLQQNFNFGGKFYSSPNFIDKIVSLKTETSTPYCHALIKHVVAVLEKYRPMRKYKSKVPKVNIVKSLEECKHEYVNVTYKTEEDSTDKEERSQFIKNKLTDLYPVDLGDIEYEFDDESKLHHYNMLSQELYLAPVLDDKSSAIKEMERCGKILESLQNEYATLSDEITKDMSDLESIQEMNKSLASKLKSSEESVENAERHRDMLNMVTETKGIREEYSSLRQKYIEKQKKKQEQANIISEDDIKEQSNYIEELNKKIFEFECKLAEEDKEINDLEALLDQPGPAELTMYQKRFFELYDQISANTIETKQFYDLHNTLIDSKQYIEKEINLLNSVLDNYPRAMSSANYRDQFFNQLEGIVDWVTQTKAKINLISSTKKESRDALHSEWTNLMELEREYAMIVSKLNMLATPERRLKNVQLFDD